jgi:hypothetical protein
MKRIPPSLRTDCGLRHSLTLRGSGSDWRLLPVGFCFRHTWATTPRAFRSSDRRSVPIPRKSCDCDQGVGGFCRIEHRPVAWKGPQWAESGFGCLEHRSEVLSSSHLYSGSFKGKCRHDVTVPQSPTSDFRHLTLIQ